MRFYQRQGLKIAILTILVLGLSLGLSWKMSASKYRLNNFLTLAYQNDLDPEQNEVAATYFGETLVGWFRNPAFLAKLNANFPDLNLSWSAYKQERQNLVVDLVYSPAGNEKDLQKTLIQVLNQEIQNYNKLTNSKFLLIDQGFKSQEVPNQVAKLLILIGILAFAIISAGGAVWEKWKGLLVDKEQLTQILQAEIVEYLDSHWEKNNLTLLFLLMQRLHPLLILAGVDLATDLLAVALAHQNNAFGEKLVLVDGDLQARNLQKSLGIAENEEIKGHTDIFTKISEKLNLQDYCYNLNDNLDFVPAGKGKCFLLEVMKTLAEHQRTLVHTSLPQNLEILRLEGALFLVVKIGVTKIKHLQEIRRAWTGKIYIVLAD